MVSIILACYNCATYVAEAIESALGQTWPCVEVLVVDDGSDDGTSEIVAQYPVRYFRSMRSGVAAARNRALSECRGDYVIFLDGDDRLLPEAAAAGALCLMQHPDCCMSMGYHNLITEFGGLIRNRRKPVGLRDPYARLLRSNFIECTSSVLFRRDLLVQCGGFREQLTVGEDYDLYLRLVRVYRICMHAETVAEYRMHQNNISHRSALMLTTTLRVLHSQRPHAWVSLKRAACYVWGAWSWRRKYGRQLTRELATDRSPDSLLRQRELWLLARAYPLGVLIVLATRISPRFSAALFPRESPVAALAERQPLDALQHR